MRFVLHACCGLRVSPAARSPALAFVFVPRTAPVSDVTVVSGSSACAAGYKQVTPPEFPGTVVTCNCEAANAPTLGFKNPGLYFQKCNSSQTWCTEYSEQSSQSLNKWRGLNLCFQTYDDTQGMSAASRPSSFGGQACPSGFSACGSASGAAALLPSTEVTCAPTGLPCPIASVSIASSAVAGLTCTSFTALAPVAGTRYLCVSRAGVTTPQTNGGPLVFSRVAVDQQCFPGQNFRKTPDQSAGDVRNKVADTCMKTDDRWVQADSVSEVNMYQLNGVPAFPTTGAVPTVGTYPPQFNALMAADVSMYLWSTFPQVLWKNSTCPISRRVIIQDMTSIGAIVSATLIILIFGVLATVVDGYFNVLALRNNSSHGGNVRAAHGIVFCVFALVKTGALVTALQVADSIKGDFAAVTPNFSVCTDATSQSTLDFFKSQLASIIGYNSALIALSLVDVVMSLKEVYEGWKTRYTTPFCPE